MLGATSGIEKSEELGKAALELASAILGVDTIVDNCQVCFKTGLYGFVLCYYIYLLD